MVVESELVVVLSSMKLWISSLQKRKELAEAESPPIKR